MLNSIYINNYRCLQNFSFGINGLKSALLLGRNSSGKSNFFDAVEVLQKIGRGITQVNDLVKKEDFSFGNTEQPITLEITVQIDANQYRYTLEIEFPEHFRSAKVKTERLSCDGHDVLLRDGGRTFYNQSTEFFLDWHHIGLPLVYVRNEKEPVAVFRNWLKRILILSPVPRYFDAVSRQETDVLERSGRNISDWARKLLTDDPSVYSVIAQFLKQRLPDFAVFKFDTIGKEEKELIFTFEAPDQPALKLNFFQLSDGEKMFFLSACVLASFQTEQPVLCLWDEPDNYISLVELGHFISTMRKTTESKQKHGQMIMTSHNAQVIHEFSRHNTFIIMRAWHTQPSRLQLLAEKTYISPTLIEAFENGELD